MNKGVLTISLLLISNMFMTLAWHKRCILAN
jgi:uncharacterized protein (DUF486 family)